MGSKRGHKESWKTKEDMKEDPENMMDACIFINRNRPPNSQLFMDFIRRPATRWGD